MTDLAAERTTGSLVSAPVTSIPQLAVLTNIYTFTLFTVLLQPRNTLKPTKHKNTACLGPYFFILILFFYSNFTLTIYINYCVVFLSFMVSKCGLLP